MLDKPSVLSHNKTSQPNQPGTESTLRGVDLNLLTVFDAVMQEQNITRAAQHLNMSQPAVSNAVSRLKTMFNDELFMRQGRGIQPTLRARQLYAPVHQALQLIRNELPGTAFTPEFSDRQFTIAICNPCDARFAPDILKVMAEKAPNVLITMDAESSTGVEDKLHYRELDFSINYTCLTDSGFASEELFEDEIVVIASRSHSRIDGSITVEELEEERHATLSEQKGDHSFVDQAYRNINCNIAYKGSSLGNILYVVEQSDLITLAPRSLIDSWYNRDQLQVLDFPLSDNSIKAYLSWHESSERDKGHTWMRQRLTEICRKSLV
ncbi:transcriptional regulator LeuO [Vibrio albus]|jgi:LysR family transcriptional activator for leuABCD operon|uniref:Transcriptional regulator LeuO n=1 Tax=Vibrio albus TaxID=2200953 RepID=A0A2U3B5N8_9VIBR|nr:transcriptional regulator LeuO [Vibrio albus]PWI32034.1 transcriptional regulator LeuO [Vibrio albus]